MSRSLVRLRDSFCPTMLCLVLLTSIDAAAAAPPEHSPEAPLVRHGRVQLTLAGAELIIAASRAEADKMGVAVNISVVDDGGHLVAFARMDSARPGSVYTSITKATSAATKRGDTGPLPSADAADMHLSLAVEHAAAQSGGKFTTLKGGIAIIVDGEVIGAVGVGGASGEQDADVARAGADALLSALSGTPVPDPQSQN